MFGKNEVHKPFRDPAGSLLVNSIFPTMQGEGPDAGKSAIFLRLTHCNLRCWFCDTEFSEGETILLQNLVSKIEVLVEQHNCQLLVITGGEPLLQNIIPLVAVCNSLGIRVSVETAGTVMLPGVEKFFNRLSWTALNRIICSPKTPQINKELEPFISAFKYIVRHGCVDDRGLPNTSTQQCDQKMQVYRPDPFDKRPIYLQPMDEQNEWANKMNLDQAVRSCLRHNYILSVQLHKLAGLP